jgi:hypothetical protein
MSQAPRMKTRRTRAFDPWVCPLPQPQYDLRQLNGKFESYAQATAECHLRIDQLKQVGSDEEAEQLALDLAACATGGGRCLSPACSICCGRMRLWLTEQMLKLWLPYRQLQFWTLIPVKFAVSAGQLRTFSPIRLGDALRQQLARLEIEGPIVGGIDGEFDQARGVWQPHPHLIAPSDLRGDMAELRKRFYPQAPNVYRPVTSVKVRNRPKLFSYVHKSYWPERARWQTREDAKRSQDHRLQEARHVEWLLWRDQFELTDFLFLRGVRRHACRLELTPNTGRSSNDNVTT